MSKHMLFDGILIKLSELYKTITKSNLIENKKIQRYYFKKIHNLKIFKNENLNNEELEKIMKITHFFKNLNVTENDLTIFIIILFENKQTLKNLFRFMIMKWNKQKLSLPSKYHSINFTIQLENINVNNFTLEVFLEELSKFVKQEKKMKTKKLLLFISNCLIGYYTNII